MIIDDILNNILNRDDTRSEIWWCETEEDKNEMIAFAINFGITYKGKEISSYQDLGDSQFDVFQVKRNDCEQFCLLTGYHCFHRDAQTWQDFKEKFNIDLHAEHIALSDYLMG